MEGLLDLLVPLRLIGNDLRPLCGIHDHELGEAIAQLPQRILRLAEMDRRLQMAL